MRRASALCCLTVLAALTPAWAETPLTSGFTYQGRLLQDGQPVNGTVNLTFELYDEAAGGNLLGSQALADTPVANGLFTVLLNDADQLGAGVFNGSRRWLQVSVEGNLIDPRQELTATPYALFAARPWALDAGNLSYAGGNVGIGMAPEQALSVAGTIQSTAGGFMFPDGTVQASAATGGDGFWSSSGFGIYNNNPGPVGIGRSDPLFNLDTNSANGFGARIGMQAAGGGSLVVACNPGDNRVWLEGYNSTDDGSADEMLITGWAGGALPKLSVFANSSAFSGNLGIGTSTPLSKLDIAAAGEGAELLRFTTERPWVFRQIYTGPSAGLQLLSTVGLKQFEITASTGTNVATFVADGANPRVGIGTTTPVSRLDIAAQDGLGITGFQPFLTLRDSNAGNARSVIQGANGDIVFYTEAALATGNPPLVIRNGGTTSVRVLEIRGADLAEKFPTREEKVEPGTVMEIDPENAGELRIARGAYNQRVAGVVSGANDLPAGAILGHLPGMDDAPPIALSGRAWTLCDASEQAIEPGHLLTTSNLPGHAMRAADRERAHGAVIGKAMTSLKCGEKGLVLVLVNLQ